MQPLALQNATITADAGESGASSATPAKGSGGAVFGELLAAATSVAGDAVSSAQQTDNAAEPQQAGQGEEAVAALAAATQVATKGVTLKAMPLPAEIQVTPAVETTAEVVAGDRPSDQSDEAIELTANAKDDATSPDPASSPDPANMVNMDVQALIHMAVNVTIPKTTHEEPTDLEHVPSEQIVENDDDAPAPLANVTGDAAAEAVNSLTQSSGVDGVLTPALTQAPTADAEIVETAAPPRIAALQAVSWFDSKAQSAVKPVGPAKVEDIAQLNVDSDVEIQPTTDQTDAKLDADAREENAAADPSLQQTNQSGIDQTAAPLIGVQPVNAQAQVEAGEPQRDDDLLLQRSNAPLPLPQSSDAAAPGVLTVNAPTESSQDSPVAGSAVESDKFAPSTPSDARQPQALAQNEPSVIRDITAARSQSSDIRGLAQVEATNISAPAATEIFAAAQSLAPETLIVKTPDTPITKAPLAKADASDADEKISADASTQTPVKADINIRELLKLGVTDATLTHEGPQLAVQAPQAETITPVATADMTPGAASTPQASTVATSNVETNGERRSIADDIRLRALERMVVNAARNGTQILSIQLYPPGLGQVVLRLAMDGQRLRLTTRASNTEAAETLRNMETDLRSALAGNGLQLTGFDVSEDGTNDDAPRRQQPAEPVIKTRSGGTDESFTVELNA